MTIQYVNTGSSPNKGDGDSIRTAFTKINESFRYLSTLTTGGGTIDVGTNTTGIYANLGDLKVTKSTVTTTGTNQDIIFNPNGTGKVRFINTPIQFDNSTGGNIGSGAHILYTRGSNQVVGLGIDDINSSLRIVGDKSQLGTLADFGLYTGPLNSWESKVYIDYRGSIIAQGNIFTYDDFESQGNVFSQGNVTANVDVIAGRYLQATYGIKFTDGTIQTSAVSTTTATSTVLGLIRLGDTLTATPDGIVNVSFAGFISTTTIATTSSLGIIQVGPGLSITQQGILSVTGAGNTGTIITTSTVATTSSLGIVKIGLGINVTADGTISISGAAVGLGNLLVDDTTIYPNDVKPVYLANKDVATGDFGSASYIKLPSAADNLGDLKLSTPSYLTITTEADAETGIIISPNVDGFGPGYIAIGTSGDVVTAGTFIFSNNAGVDLWPSQALATFATEISDVGTLDLFTYDGDISLRPNDTSTVIITGGGLEIRSGYLKFPDGTTMATAASGTGGNGSGVTSFNGSSGTVTFSATNIISQLGYTPYNSTTNVAKYITTASITWNNLIGKPTFATVSTSGSYTDLSNKPTALSSFTNDTNYITTTSLLTLNGSIIPSVDSTYDLGTSSTQWRSLYVSSSTIYIGGQPLTVVQPGNKLEFNGQEVGAGGGFNQTLNTTDPVTFANVTTDHVTFNDGTTQTTAFTSTTVSSNLTNTVDNSNYINSGTLSYQMLVNGTGTSFTINYSRPLTSSTQISVNAIKFPNGVIQTQAFTGSAEPASPTVEGTVYAYTSATYNNTLLGYNVGNVSITGAHNIAIGAAALKSAKLSNHNIALGNAALCSISDGSCNIAIGINSLCGNLTGYNNLAIGPNSMSQGTGGYGNIALGFNSLKNNTIGNYNVVAGHASLNSNTTGYANIAIGCNSLSANLTGLGNTAVGSSALSGGSGGCYNTALGFSSGKNVGYENVAIGNLALGADQGGINNIAIGSCALCVNTIGACNVAIGKLALSSNTTGSTNIAIGFCSLGGNTVGACNIALGQNTLKTNTTGCDNIAVGASALLSNTAGTNNIALGKCSLYNNSVGSFNTVIGYNAGVNMSTACCNLILGSGAGSAITGGHFNVIIGNYNGAAMAVSSNKIAIADQAGNLRMFFTNTGALSFNTSTDFGVAGYVLQSNGDGSPPTWSNSSGLTSGYANTATHIDGGTVNQIPYQTAIGRTSFFGPGTAGQILISNGTASAPSYANTSSFLVGNSTYSNSSTNIIGGTSGQILYQSASGATGFAGPGTTGQLLVSGGTDAPIYTNTATIQVGFATNLLGGTSGQLVYQSTSGATTFVTNGTAGQLLVSAGANAPTYTNTTSIQVGFAKNVLGGISGQIHYQSASGATAFVTNGTTGSVLVSNAGASPNWQNTLTLSGTTIASSTQTGALQVAGGVGIGGKLFAGGNVETPQLIASSTATSTSTKTANALYVAGGAWIDGSAVIGGSSIFNGVVVFNSSTIYNSNSSVSTSTNFLKVHQATGTNWTFNDGADIGIVLDYYSGSASSGFLGRTNSTGYLEWYGSGSAGPTLFTGVLGTFRTGNVLVASGNNNAGNTNTGALVVTGGVGISQNLYVGGTITGNVSGIASSSNNLTGGTGGSLPYQSGGSTTALLPIGSAGQILVVNAGGTGPLWTATNLVSIGQATSSTNLAGGTPGQIPYQTSDNVTNFFGPGTSGQLLVSAGANTPTYTNTTSIQVGFATNVLGGSAGSVPYQSASGATSLLAIGTVGQILTVNPGATAPQWSAVTGITVGNANNATTATNIAGGTVGQLAYQSAGGVTGFVGPGTAGQLLVSAGANSPTYTNTTSIQVGFATNVLGGSAGSLPYQSASGATTFVSLGSSGYVLTAGASSPQWSPLSGLSAGNSTTATNISGGTVGQIPYQTAAGTTDFFGAGTSGQILTSGGAGTPSYVNTSTLQIGFANSAIHVRGGAAGSLIYQTGTNATGNLAIGSANQILTVNANGTAPQWTTAAATTVGNATTATHLEGGTIYQIPYQTAAGRTSFFGPGLVGHILQSNGVGAVPSYTNAPSIGTITLSTATVFNPAGVSVGTSAVTIDSFSVSTYRSVKYVISVTGTTDYQTTEIILVHNGSNAFIAYDSVFSGAVTMMTFTATVVGGLVNLQGIGTTSSNTVKVGKIYIGA